MTEPRTHGYVDVNDVHMYYEMTARARRSSCCTAG